MRQMKWYGWGDYKITFPIAEKPLLWPWIEGKLNMDGVTSTLPVAKDQVAIPAPVLDHAFVAALKAVLTADQYTADDDERLHRCYGKSYPNLFWARKGYIAQAPDMVVLPRSHDDVVKVMTLANEHNVCVIPFGGGTNIVGGVDPRDDQEGLSPRMIVTLDMRQMNRLLSFDPKSNIAVIECGALGPKMEADLNAVGLSLGHFPDSFEYSTLGGWIATRSAGMQSDSYGKIEEMVVSLKMVTPTGTIVTKAFPASSAGPDLNRLMCGSEGVLGVITEATMRVHPAPKTKDYRGFLFKSFEDGIAAIQEMMEMGFLPSMVRLQDSGMTELAFQMKAPKKGLEGLITKGMKVYLRNAGYTAPCIMVIGWEGLEATYVYKRAEGLAIIKKFKGFPLGASVGSSWSKDKFNMPYLRDYVMDRAVMCDVAETSALWTRVLPLYRATVKTMKAKFLTEPRQGGFIGCHVSHTYETGCSLYFTYAATQQTGRELEQYYEYKKLITETFIANGGTLSHHHAVGYEHRPWMEQEQSPTGIEALRAIKERLDPRGILNPGKLIPERASKALEQGLDRLSDNKIVWGATVIPPRAVAQPGAYN